MKKATNFEDELDAIRQQNQKEMEKMGWKKWNAKINKEARETAKKFGFENQFISSKKNHEYNISPEPIFIKEESEEYNETNKSDK